MNPKNIRVYLCLSVVKIRIKQPQMNADKHRLKYELSAKSIVTNS